MKSQVSKNTNHDWHPNIWPPFTQITNSIPQIEVTHGKDALIFTKNPSSYSGPEAVFRELNLGVGDEN